MWKVEIEKVSNGFVVRFIAGNEEEVAVFEQRGFEEWHKDHVISMLYDILSFFNELREDQPLSLVIGYEVNEYVNSRSLEDYIRRTEYSLLKEVSHEA